MPSPDLHRLASPERGHPAPAGSADPERAATSYPFGRRVLITEDSWLIADEWQAVLEGSGYTVIGIAVSADEVLELCLQERPDFILMDIRLLGKRDGIEAATEVRGRAGTPSAFISAHDDLEIRARAAAAKPLGWIVKPIASARLPELLTQLAQRYM